MNGRRNHRGAVYLLCWAGTPYPAGKRPAHYCGFAYPASPDDADPGILAEIALAEHTRVTGRYLTAEQAAGVALRIEQHRAGRGARLTAVIAAAGIKFTVVRVWASATEAHEKGLKHLNNRRVLCPACTPGTQAGTGIRPRRFRRPKVRKPVLETITA
jgi:hypothetical protein